MTKASIDDLPPPLAKKLSILQKCIKDSTFTWSAPLIPELWKARHSLPREQVKLIKTIASEYYSACAMHRYKSKHARPDSADLIKDWANFHFELIVMTHVANFFNRYKHLPDMETMMMQYHAPILF